MSRTNKQYKNIYELTEDFRGICLSHPDVNNYLYGIYRIGEKNDIKYSLVSFTLENVMRVSDSLLSIGFNLLYADRLTSDRSNTAFVQSVGTSVILECLNAFKKKGHLIDVQPNYQIRPFTEQFADNCAGVVATVTVQVPSFVGQCEWINVDNCLSC